MKNLFYGTILFGALSLVGCTHNTHRHGCCVGHKVCPCDCGCAKGNACVCGTDKGEHKVCPCDCGCAKDGKCVCGPECCNK
jgi:hypothetical protein